MKGDFSSILTTKYDNQISKTLKIKLRKHARNCLNRKLEAAAGV
jgi:hypothetical protein